MEPKKLIDESPSDSAAPSSPPSDGLETVQKLPPARDEKGRLLPGRQSINPLGGKLNRKPILQEIKKQLELDPSRLERIVEKLLTLCEIGDDRAFKEFRDMIDGKPATKIIGPDVEEGEASIKVQFVNPDK